MLPKPMGYETIRVSLPKVEATGLVRIAKQKGYFEKHGLHVIVTEQELGQQSLEDVFAGQADLAAVAETPLVDASFLRKDFRVLGTIHTAENNVKLIARADHGIRTIDDLKGKKVGTKLGTDGEYVLHLMLLQHGFDLPDIQLVDKSPNELKTLFEQGDIDAFALREPYVFREKLLLDDKTIVFEPTFIYTSTYNLVSSSGFSQNHSSALKHFLEAIKDAEQFAETHKNEAIDLLSADLNLEKAYLVSSWNDSSYALTLNQLLVLTMENEARWRINSNKMQTTHVPNFLEWIDTTFLQSVHPASVNIEK